MLNLKPHGRNKTLPTLINEIDVFKAKLGLFIGQTGWDKGCGPQPWGVLCKWSTATERLDSTVLQGVPEKLAQSLPRN